VGDEQPVKPRSISATNHQWGMREPPLMEVFFINRHLLISSTGFISLLRKYKITALEKFDVVAIFRKTV
jgi:hypothetical protein